VEGDPTQLHQVLLNLCLNARDALPEEGVLSLTAENFEVDGPYASMMPGLRAGPHVLISVSDTGTGIPQHIIDRIFDPFFTTKEVGKGTGLGLSTVLGIVRTHGGVINVCSDPRGTKFSILLPSSINVFQADEPKVEAAPPTGHGETILIVDDEAAIREVTAAALTESGYHVLAAHDGPAALAFFVQQSKEIDVVLTDVVMPVMSGLALVRTLRTLNDKVNIIICSSRDADHIPSELTKLGRQEYLAKPYTRDALLRTVDRVLNHASAT
jgi:two-component system cell cycle sensor histidine kinase/response regulator CckA